MSNFSLEGRGRWTICTRHSRKRRVLDSDTGASTCLDVAATSPFTCLSCAPEPSGKQGNGSHRMVLDCSSSTVKIETLGPGH